MKHDPSYPNHPGSRRNAPETSRLAADSIAPLASSIRARVLSVIADAGAGGAIGDDVADHLDLLVYQVRARISELRAAGLIADSGRRRIGASGRPGVVWVLKAYLPVEPADPQGDLLAAA